MKLENLFDLVDYQTYLRSRLLESGKTKRGIKTRFAKAIACDAAYVSRILNGEAHLSLEQGMRANAFLEHGPEEADFFLTLIGFARAGSQALKDYYYRQMQIQKQNYLTLSLRIKNTETLPENTQAIYYSTWVYAAIDIATSISGLQTAEKIGEHFQLPLERVMEVLRFLKSAGVVEEKNGRWVNTNRPIYLPSNSPHIKKHHNHWRLKALQYIEEAKGNDIHYSSIVSISRKDFEKLKELFIQCVSKARETVKSSSDEIIAVYNIDCFEFKG